MTDSAETAPRRLWEPREDFLEAVVPQLHLVGKTSSWDKRGCTQQQPHQTKAWSPAPRVQPLPTAWGCPTPLHFQCHLPQPRPDP